MGCGKTDGTGLPFLWQVLNLSHPTARTSHMGTPVQPASGRCQSVGEGGEGGWVGGGWWGGELPR
jgi:hypothetical protein